MLETSIESFLKIKFKGRIRDSDNSNRIVVKTKKVRQFHREPFNTLTNTE